MKVVACGTPVGTLHPAPLTSLPLESTVGTSEISAFWASDDQYYLCAETTEHGVLSRMWFQLHSEPVLDDSSTADRQHAATLMADIIPIGGGKVAFPIGSTGRRFYRVWRTTGSGTRGTTQRSRTRILEVRAARSRRRQA